MENFSPISFSRLINNNRSLRRNRSNDEIDQEESLVSEEEDVTYEKWNPDVETVNINWKGWKRSEHPKLRRGSHPNNSKGVKMLKLSELAAKCVAMYIPFEMVENFQPPVPEELQQRITFWSFPEWDDDICLYTCLANSNDDEFLKGEILFENGNVHDVIQIGFHLNATVSVNTGEKFSVSISFDRRHITSCICTCKAVPLWCCHIVAACLLRIYNTSKVQMRPPISESLTRLNRDQLQKFSQYLVSRLPEQYLQTAQRLLDDLNSNQPLPINTVCGAPDTTAGASVNEYAMWCLDNHQLHLNIKKQMNRFGNVPPMVFSDVNMLTNNIPAIINEYNSMLRPLKIGEPDSLCNLLSIVRDMYRKNDRNALPLLEIITDEMTNCVQIILWWFANKSGLNGDCGYQIKYYYNGNSNSYIYQASAAKLCDEIVSLWRLAALNPAINPKERISLRWKFKDWHFKIIELIWGNWKHTPNAFDLYNFPGFKPCIEACKLSWDNFPLPGITYCGYGSKKDNLWFYDSHQNALGIDIMSLSCIKRPSAKLLISLESCYLHVERIRSTVSRVLNDSLISSDLPDYRTVKYLKEHFSSSRDEVFRFVSHLITLVDTWVNDDCEDNDVYASSANVDTSMFDNNAINSKCVLGENFFVCQSSRNGISSGMRDRMLCLEKQINNELRKEIYDSGCTTNRKLGVQCSSHNMSHLSNELYPVQNIEREVYEMIMQDFLDDTLEGASNSAGCSSAYSFFDNGSVPWSMSRPYNAIFENFADVDDIWQRLILRAEGLWAFGHTKEASFIVRQIAEHIINNPPDQKIMYSGTFVKSKRRKGQAVINPIAHRLTFTAIEKMELYKFLLNILASSKEHHDVAFKIGLLSLELPRTPASIKPLEVKLFHLENDIADILRKIPLTDEQYKIFRTRLEKLRDGTYKTRGHKLLPNALMSYILDATMTTCNDGKNRSVSKEVSESLCFEAALASLRLKPDVCEYEHSLLVEGLRRQRCDLALRMLDLYKDEPKKIFKIMDVIIDRDIDVNMKKPLHLWYYQEQNKQEKRLKMLIEKHKKKKKPKFTFQTLTQQQQYQSQHQTMPVYRLPLPPLQQPQPQQHVFLSQINFTSVPPPPIPTSQPRFKMQRRMMSICNPPPPVPQIPATIMPFIRNTVYLTPPPVHVPLLSPKQQPRLADISLPAASLQAAQIRYPAMLPPPQPYQIINSQSPAPPLIINSQPPAPPFIQSSFPRPGYQYTVAPTVALSPPAFMKCIPGRTSQHLNVPGKLCGPRNPISKPSKNKCGKSGCKRPVSVVYRNRSTDALSHSMTELAKSVLFHSGGHLASSFYVRDSETGIVKTPNHVLHMCALQLAMYGLGVSNNASTSWESRSYSPHVAMLTSLAIDIGAPALMFIIENWPGHLTPAEAISLADRGSRSENTVVANLAARLALTCLTYADKLNSHEIIQAINQCRNLGLEMEEKACCEIGKVAKSHSLPSDVLFYVSKLWYNIFNKDEVEELDDHRSAKGDISNSSRYSLPSMSYCSAYRPSASMNGQSKSTIVLTNEIKTLQKRTYYLLTSYRLSMIAFQNITADISEEKAHYRFHCLPNYTSDVYRAMHIAQLLGDKWVQHFSMVAETTLVNPFLLYEVACGAAVHFAKKNPSAIHYYMCTAMKTLINKCEAMFFLYLHNKSHNMAQYEEEEFINMAHLAHKAFSVLTDGPYRYQEWLYSLRSADTLVRDVYKKITKAIEQEEKANKLAARDEAVDYKENVLPFHCEDGKSKNDNKEEEDDDDEEDDDEDDDDEDDEEEEEEEEEEDDVDADVDDDDDDDDDDEGDNDNEREQVEQNNFSTNNYRHPNNGEDVGTQDLTRINR